MITFLKKNKWEWICYKPIPDFFPLNTNAQYVGRANAIDQSEVPFRSDFDFAID